MERKIIIPETIEDITLGQYQKYIELCKKELDPYTFNCRKIALFTGLLISEIDNIKQVDLEFILTQIDLALNSDGEFKQTFTLNGVEFGMIPNFDKMQSKEFFDLSMYGTEPEDLHKIMSIIYRPIKKKQGNTYSINNYNGTDQFSNEMKLMPLSHVNGSLAFFLTLQNDLYLHFLKFTEAEQAKETERQTTLKNGDGMQLSTN